MCMQSKCFAIEWKLLNHLNKMNKDKDKDKERNTLFLFYTKMYRIRIFLSNDFIIINPNNFFH